MPLPRTTRRRPPNLVSWRMTGDADDVEVVVHGYAYDRNGTRGKSRRGWSGSARSERRQELAPRFRIQVIERDGIVTLVAKDLEQGGPALFLRRLQLAICHAQQMHLKGLHEKILGIATTRTGQRQISLPSGHESSHQRESIAQFRYKYTSLAEILRFGSAADSAVTYAEA